MDINFMAKSGSVTKTKDQSYTNNNIQEIMEGDYYDGGILDEGGGIRFATSTHLIS